MALLFACTQSRDAAETTKSIEEAKPFSREEKRRNDENIRIAKYPDNVRRVGDTLYLKLASGVEVILKDQGECEEYYTCGDSYFKEYLPDLDIYILYFQLYEGSHYLVISRKSGERYLMHDLPEVSPDSLHLVVASSDGEAYGESSISVWRVELEELIQEFYSNPIYYTLNYFVKWQGNSTVIIKRFMRSEKLPFCTKSDFVEGQLALTKTGGSWKLDKEFVEGTVNCNPDN